MLRRGLSCLELLLALALSGTVAAGAVSLKEIKLTSHPAPKRSLDNYGGLPYERLAITFMEAVPARSSDPTVLLESDRLEISFAAETTDARPLKIRGETSDYSCLDPDSIEVAADGGHTLVKLDAVRAGCEIAVLSHDKGYYVDLISEPLIRGLTAEMGDCRQGGQGVATIDLDLRPLWSIELQNGDRPFAVEGTDHRGHLRFQSPRKEKDGRVFVPYEVLPQARPGSYELVWQVPYRLRFLADEELSLLPRRRAVKVAYVILEPSRSLSDYSETNDAAIAEIRQLLTRVAERVAALERQARQGDPERVIRRIRKIEDSLRELRPAVPAVSDSVPVAPTERVEARMSRLEKAVSEGAAKAEACEQRIEQIESASNWPVEPGNEMPGGAAAAASQLEAIEKRLGALEANGRQLDRATDADRLGDRETEGGPVADSGDELEGLKTRGRRALAERRWQDAYAISAELRELGAADEESRFLLARSAYYTQDWPTASTTLTDLFSQTNRLDYLYWLGKLRFGERDYAEAARVLDLVSEVGYDYPYDSEIWYLLGIAHDALDQVEQASFYFEKCARLCSDSRDREIATAYLADIESGRGLDLHHGFERFEQPLDVSRLRLSTLTGESIALNDFRGQVLLLHFWATWCLPCEQELPSLHSFYEEAMRAYREHGLVLLTVSLDKEAQIARSYFEARGFRMPILFDPDGTLVKLYTWRGGIPKTLIVGRDGRALAITSHRNWQDPGLHREIETYLSTGSAVE